MNQSSNKNKPNEQAENIAQNVISNETHKPSAQKINQSAQKMKQAQQSMHLQLVFNKSVLLIESDNVLKRIDLFNQNNQRIDLDYIEMEELFCKHITANIHPSACSEVGEFLLNNGKFIVAFIQVVTRNEKNDYLKNYLYNYFSQVSKIEYQKQIFIKNRQKFALKAVLLKEKDALKDGKKTKKLNIQHSPSSSKNQANWSTRVEKDTNSPFISSIFDSGLTKNSKQRLKRVKRQTREEINEQQQQRMIKNTKKSVNNKSANKSTKKTKPVSIPKKNGQKRTVSKSNTNKRQHKQHSKDNRSAQHKSANQSAQNDHLGSCYHYEIIQNRKDHHKQLLQVRSSARLNSKSKRKSQVALRQSIRKQSNRKSNGKQSQKHKSKSKGKNKNSKTKKQNKDNKDNKLGDAEQNSDYTNDSPYQSGSESEDGIVSASWVKKNLKKIQIKNVQMYSNFQAMSENDERITKFLLQMQNSEQASQPAILSQRNIGNGQDNITHIQKFQPQEEHTETRLILRQPLKNAQNQGQKIKKFEQIKKQYEIEQLPLTIDSVIDPNINNHGIYALLKLGRVTELEMGTAYAVTPLTYGSRVNRRHIKQDLEAAKILTGSFKDNIGYIPINEHILKMIEQKVHEDKQKMRKSQ